MVGHELHESTWHDMPMIKLEKEKLRCQAMLLGRALTELRDLTFQQSYMDDLQARRRSSRLRAGTADTETFFDFWWKLNKEAARVLEDYLIKQIEYRRIKHFMYLHFLAFFGPDGHDSDGAHGVEDACDASEESDCF